MTKKALFIFSILLSVTLFGQELKPIAKKVKTEETAGRSFQKFNIFTVSSQIQKQLLYSKEVPGVSVLELNTEQLQKLTTEKPNSLEMNIPFEGKELKLSLVKNNLFAEGFHLSTDKGTAEYHPGVYYQGIIKGDDQSVVAMSFFDNDVIGIVSIPEVGNVVVGKTQNDKVYVSYNDARLQFSNPVFCETTDKIKNTLPDSGFQLSMLKEPKEVDKVIKLYFELGNDLFIKNNSNIDTTVNWMTGVFNNIKTLFNNDGIQVALSEVYLWTTKDPFTGKPNVLTSFNSARRNFYGDIAQLINLEPNGGVAYQNSLCTSNAHSYTGVSSKFESVPTFSWTVNAMTHELGHNIASPHTHSCSWNGNNTAIDGCGPLAGNNEGCNGPLPTNGGTIMSYCHKTIYHINFANGFGDQPAALMRNRISSKTCLTPESESCKNTITNFELKSISDTSATLSFTDSKSSQWKYQLSTLTGQVLSTAGTTDKTINLTNLTPGTYYQIAVATTCSSNYENQITIFTDADWCNEDFQFTDTGLTTTNYGNNQKIVKTFFPSNQNAPFHLYFTEFNLKNGDYISIYDGKNTSSPVFSHGNKITGSTLPKVFSATNNDKALTFEFTSDSNDTSTGWIAKFKCEKLAIADNPKDQSVKIFPNPTKETINITADEPIMELLINEPSGKLLQREKLINSNQFKVNI